MDKLVLFFFGATGCLLMDEDIRSTTIQQLATMGVILLLIGASGGFGIFVVPPIWRMDITDGVQCPMVEGEIVNTSTIEVVKVKQEDNTTKIVYLPMGLKNNFLNGSRFSQPVCQ
jgi:hypothetical protein